MRPSINHEILSTMNSPLRYGHMFPNWFFHFSWEIESILFFFKITNVILPGDRICEQRHPSQQYQWSWMTYVTSFFASVFYEWHWELTLIYLIRIFSFHCVLLSVESSSECFHIHSITRLQYEWHSLWYKYLFSHKPRALLYTTKCIRMEMYAKLCWIFYFSFRCRYLAVGMRQCASLAGYV